MIGTSVALALRRTGVHVGLFDRHADAVVIATPPSSVVAVLREAQARGMGPVYTDVASAKARICADAERAGCDLTTYVPGHPIAGSERSGPRAARPDLFAGRPWVLCPHPTTAPGPMRVVPELVARCGGVPGRARR